MLLNFKELGKVGACAVANTSPDREPDENEPGPEAIAHGHAPKKSRTKCFGLNPFYVLVFYAILCRFKLYY